jgi:DNA-binding NtrC family response regulator
VICWPSTVALYRRTGFFERADYGTLFLDEIDCLPLSAQARLLRVLQEGDFERVGGRQTLRADVRIIAASNQNLEKIVDEGGFRRDLFYRLNVVPLHIPPLRERTDDLAPLVHHFLRRLAEKYRSTPKVLAQPVWSKLLNYSWPGNLRELENVLERAFLFARDPIIVDVAVPTMSRTGEEKCGGVGISLKALRQRAAREAEAKVIVEALKQFHGNVSAVARCMDLTPCAIHMKLRSHGISAAAFRMGEGASQD